MAFANTPLHTANPVNWGDAMNWQNNGPIPSVGLPTPDGNLESLIPNAMVDPAGSLLGGGGAPPVAGGGSAWGIFDNFLSSKSADGTTTQGWGGLALGAAQGLGNLWLGSQQLSMGKDALKEGKRQFNINNKNQTSLINTQMEDRQAARVASSRTGAYESVGSYMNKNQLGA